MAKFPKPTDYSGNKVFILNLDFAKLIHEDYDGNEEGLWKGLSGDRRTTGVATCEENPLKAMRVRTVQLHSHIHSRQETHQQEQIQHDVSTEALRQEDGQSSLRLYHEGRRPQGERKTETFWEQVEQK